MCHNNLNMTYLDLVKNLVDAGYLRTEHIINAFKNIDRANFVPRKFKKEAYVNAPLPIGHGQTISQPLTVAFMLELLAPGPSEKVLDIGAGSGWQTAILAEAVGENGAVFAVERIPEIAEFGKKNLSAYSLIERGRVRYICADGSLGLSQNAPFDKIIAAAAVRALPTAWKEQLRTGGRIVAPLGASIWLFIKKGENEFEEFEYPGFAFVPLVEGEEKNSRPLEYY